MKKQEVKKWLISTGLGIAIGMCIVVGSYTIASKMKTDDLNDVFCTKAQAEPTNYCNFVGITYYNEAPYAFKIATFEDKQHNKVIYVPYGPDAKGISTQDLALLKEDTNDKK